MRPARGLAALAAIAGARWAAAAPADAPVLSVSPPALDVGPIEVVSATASAAVHVTNTGGGTLKLLAVDLLDDGTGAAADWTVTAGPPCTAAIPPSCVLDAGQTADLALAFDPQAIGVRDVALLINYHDTADRSISIPLRGVGVGPTLDLAAPATLDFGALPLATAGAIVLPVANHGTRTLADARVTVTPAGTFSVSPAGTFSVTTASAASITVTCTPTAAGSVTGKLQLSAPDVLGSPTEISLRCAGDPGATLVATPPALVLGEVRLAAPTVAHVAVASRNAPIALTAAELETAIAGVAVRGTPATTPATLDLTAAPQAEGSLDDRILVTPGTGPMLAIPVSGAAVTASYSVPDAASLGTFCVQQPTTPRIVSLTSTGTATLRLSAPRLASTTSPFELTLVAPLGYPNIVAPRQRAIVSATPRQRGTAGVASDDIVWTTDAAGATASRTTLTATFIDDGGAIAPAALGFGPTRCSTAARRRSGSTRRRSRRRSPSTARASPPRSTPARSPRSASGSIPPSSARCPSSSRSLRPSCATRSPSSCAVRASPPAATATPAPTPACRAPASTPAAAAPPAIPPARSPSRSRYSRPSCRAAGSSEAHRSPDLPGGRHLGHQHLQRDLLSQMEVHDPQDDTHRSPAEHALDAILVEQDHTGTKIPSHAVLRD
ncbi:MAG: choice-of-anchor D domain-containing protein [Deltaproteobacteria bacterium]|nr:MAG: choice-of-anchor D domain-containing protein [Deltaproteobacteria bacterium]